MNKDTKLIFEKYQKIIKEEDEQIPKIPSLPKELKGKYTPREWESIFLYKIRNHMKKRKVLKAWDILKQITNNFTKIISVDDLGDYKSSIKDAISGPRYLRYTHGRASLIKTFSVYVKALFDNNSDMIRHLTNSIASRFAQTNGYMETIKNQLDREKDNSAYRQMGEHGHC